MQVARPFSLVIFHRPARLLMYAHSPPTIAAAAPNNTARQLIIWRNGASMHAAHALTPSHSLLCTNSLTDRLSDATREAQIAVVTSLVRVVVARAFAPVLLEQLADRTETLVGVHRVALVVVDQGQNVVFTLACVVEQLAEAVGFGHLRGHIGWEWQPSD